jgi:hypothetical protein
MQLSLVQWLCPCAVAAAPSDLAYSRYSTSLSLVRTGRRSLHLEHCDLQLLWVLYVNLCQVVCYIGGRRAKSFLCGAPHEACMHTFVGTVCLNSAFGLISTW